MRSSHVQLISKTEELDYGFGALLWTALTVCLMLHLSNGTLLTSESFT